MGNIVILDEYTSNQIAAGEVIERPASVVKELVENSIDAGSSNISVEIRNGGIKYIKVTDNGSGIHEDDAEMAFERHATSKIKCPDDLDSISTLGFRGEALASIAAVSRLQLTTRTKEKQNGIIVTIEGGNLKDFRQTGSPVGTTFIIKDLFYNTPARFKFLKKDSTEAGHISDIITRIALGYPNISFKLINNGSTVIHTPGNNDLLSTIFSLYGKNIAESIIEIKYSDEKFNISGFVGKAEIARSSRNYQSIYINNRYIKCRTITSAIDEAYKTIIMKNKYPFAVLKLDVNPLIVDVNVHPSKMEVRFSNSQDIFRVVYHSVVNAVLGSNQYNNLKLDVNNTTKQKKESEEKIETDYIQQNIESSNSLRENFNNNKKTIKFLSDSPEILKGTINKNIAIIQAKAVNNTITEDIESNRLNDRTSGNDIAHKNNKSEKMMLSESILIGQVFLTYIILQYGDDMILVDQHAAHERIMYEKIKKRYERGQNISQSLISPIVIELTQQEISFVEEKMEFMLKIGFEFDDFGNNSIILRAVPYMEKECMVKKMFLQVIDDLMESSLTDHSSLTDQTLYNIACKAAVKANRRLSEIEIRNLLKELDSIENPFTCPHGRPTAVKIKKYELEKKFKRVL